MCICSYMVHTIKENVLDNHSSIWWYNWYMEHFNLHTHHVYNKRYNTSPLKYITENIIDYSVPHNIMVSQTLAQIKLQEFIGYIK